MLFFIINIDCKQNKMFLSFVSFIAKLLINFMSFPYHYLNILKNKYIETSSIDYLKGK